MAEHVRVCRWGIDLLPHEANTGITLLGFLIVAVLYAGVFQLVIFAVEAQMGTLDMPDLGRFIPAAAFSLLLILSVLRGKKAKLRTR